MMRTSPPIQVEEQTEMDSNYNPRVPGIRLLADNELDQATGGTIVVGGISGVPSSGLRSWLGMFRAFRAFAS